MPRIPQVTLTSSLDGSDSDIDVAKLMRAGIADLQAEMAVEAAFPAEVDQAARRAAGAPRLPALDRTDLEFLTIDPPTARDLDQALHIAASERGYTVHYAIADLGAFVAAGDLVDLAAHQRGETLYGADTKVPLHPKAISEDAGSLLPGQVRPALLWTIELDATGEGVGVRVERARVKSRAQLDYGQAQAQIDSGRTSETLRLLKVVGQLREAKERERGGVSLPLPDQEIVVSDDRWALAYRVPLPVEGWNAQISLLTGFAAASLMLDAGVGLVRTLPRPAEHDVARLRRTARALGISWPTEVGYADFVRALDPAIADQAAMITSCTRLLRGSGYVGFVGEVPEKIQHSALAAPYAHVTAPLRRLIDRYTGEMCLAICAGQPVPDWVLAELDSLPDVMRDSATRANRYERAIIDLVEAGLLHQRVGEKLDGVIVA
ncbi:MAG: ribonuclease catalytic domain-containing protein, partial [Nocardioides sp.]